MKNSCHFYSNCLRKVLIESSWEETNGVTGAPGISPNVKSPAIQTLSIQTICGRRLVSITSVIHQPVAHRVWPCSSSGWILWDTVIDTRCRFGRLPFPSPDREGRAEVSRRLWRTGFTNTPRELRELAAGCRGAELSKAGSLVTEVNSA